jgi:hypothetical protein
VHWRTHERRGPDVQYITGPYFRTWDQPRSKRLRDLETTVSIAEPVTAPSLTADERRVVEALARTGAFWRTDSDLPMAYGRLARRRELASIVGW